MKRLLLSLALTAFAALAVQADDASTKAPAANQHSCCKVKAAQQQASTSCYKVKAAQQQASASCCNKAKQTTVKKMQVTQVLLSPKAAASL